MRKQLASPLPYLKASTNPLESRVENGERSVFNLEAGTTENTQRKTW
jgi:hypothetical protein